MTQPFHRVLVLAYYFPPMGLSGVQRLLKFLKYMPANGWKPDVVTSGPSAYYAHDESLLRELDGLDIDIHRVGGRDPNSLGAGLGTVSMPREIYRKLLSGLSSTLFIPDNKKSWSRRALIKARELMKERDYDMIFVSGPPFSTMIAGAALSKETTIPLVLDYRDLWYGNQFMYYPTPWHAGRHKKLEYRVLMHASKITVTNRRMKEVMLTNHKHVGFEDVHIIPHGFDPADFAEQVEPLDGFTLTYTGIFYHFITPKHFFLAVADFLREHPSAPIKLHFAGILRDENKKFGDKLGLSDYIVDHGYVEHHQSVNLAQRSTALWMMAGKSRNADTHSAGKLFEYFGTRKPLLVSVQPGALQTAASQYGASWITLPTDVEAIKNAITDIYIGWRDGTLPKPNEDIVQQYDRSKLTTDLARVLNSALRIL